MMHLIKDCFPLFHNEIADCTGDPHGNEKQEEHAVIVPDVIENPMDKNANSAQIRRTKPPIPVSLRVWRYKLCACWANVLSWA